MTPRSIEWMTGLLLRAGIDPNGYGERLPACVGCGKPTSHVERIEGIDYPLCPTHKAPEEV